MDEFVGCVLRYEVSPNKSYTAILRQIEEDQKVLIFEDVFTKCKMRVSIDNILNIELVDNEIIKENGTNEENKNYENKIKTDEDKIHKTQINDTNENDTNEITTKEIELIKNDQIKTKNDTESKNLSDKTMPKIHSVETMYSILDECFRTYFPSEEQFVYIAAHNIYKMISAMFKNTMDDKIAILIDGDDFFARIGYTLAIYLHNFNYKIDVAVFGSTTSTLTAAIKQRFYNCGLKPVQKLSRTYETVIVAAKGGKLKNLDLAKLSYENVVYLDLPAKKIANIQNAIGIVYAIMTDRIELFGGRVVCIDIGVPEALLRKYDSLRNYKCTQFYVKFSSDD